MSSIFRFKFSFILILVPFLLLLVWFKGGNVVGGGEEGLAFYNPTRTLYLSQHLWWDYDGGFPTLAWISKISALSPTAFLYEKINIPNYLLQAVTFFTLLVVAGISVYFLTLKLLGKIEYSKKIALISALFYLLNPFSISQIWARGLAAQYFSFAFLPLSILFFLDGLNGKFVYFFYLTLISIIFSTAFGISTFVITYWVVLTICFIYWLNFNRTLKKATYGAFFYIASILIWIIVQSWWFLPTLISGNKIYAGYLEGYEENLGTLIGVSRNFTPDVIIRLLQKTYFFDAGFNPHIYSLYAFQLISWFIPMFLIIGLVIIFKKKELKELKLFFWIFLVGLLVSLGANPPLGNLFIYIFKHNSFLQSFRNPYEKFGIVYALGYTPIFAVGVIYLFEKIKSKKIGILAIAITLILICGVYEWPMWTGRVVAGPDGKIGIPVPSAYQELQKWLGEDQQNYRLFMTPLWGGDGAFYNWSSIRYQGLDPTMYMLNTPTISNSPKYPYFYDFMQNIRRYVERIDLVPSLALLRTKYLVNRNDAIMLTESEKLHQKFLTDTIYPPTGAELVKQSICSNISANSLQSGTAWVICKLANPEGDWSKIKYLHLTIKTFTPAFLEIAVRDKKEIRIRWDGRTVSEYRTDSNDWTEITLPLSAPSEYNPDIDFSNISMVEVFAHPKDNQQASVYEILVKGIRLDPGREEKTNEFQLVKTFGQLQVYEPLHLITPPEFGVLESVSEVLDFPQLFEQALKGRDLLDKKGFILSTQNPEKDLQRIIQTGSLEILEKDKISDTKYWFKVKDATAAGLLLLSKNFNPEWKVIPGISKERLNGGFANNLDLLKSAVLPENNHFVLNGYANGWIIDGGNQYAIIFIPQVIASIGAKISQISIILLIIVSVFWILIKWKRRYTSPH